MHRACLCAAWVECIDRVCLGNHCRYHGPIAREGSHQVRDLGARRACLWCAVWVDLGARRAFLWCAVWVDLVFFACGAATQDLRVRGGTSSPPSAVGVTRVELVFPCWVDQVHIKAGLKDGNFLLRKSQTAENTFVVVVCKGKKLVHNRIERAENGLSIVCMFGTCARVCEVAPCIFTCTSLSLARARARPLALALPL